MNYFTPKLYSLLNSRQMSRQLEFTQEAADQICQLVSENQLGIRRICEENSDLPDPQTIYRWMSRIPAFREQYARAKEMQLQALEDEILSIADDSTNDWVESKFGPQLNKEAVQRSNLRIETRKWLMAKLMPKKYGEKLDVSGELALKTVIVAPDAKQESARPELKPAFDPLTLEGE